MDIFEVFSYEGTQKDAVKAWNWLDSISKKNTWPDIINIQYNYLNDMEQFTITFSSVDHKLCPACVTASRGKYIVVNIKTGNIQVLNDITNLNQSNKES
jgi:hypothetical protein